MTVATNRAVAVLNVVAEHGMSRSTTVVIAKLDYARPSAADAEYLPATPVLPQRHTVRRDDLPCSDYSVALTFARDG